MFVVCDIIQIIYAAGDTEEASAEIEMVPEKKWIF